MRVLVWFAVICGVIVPVCAGAPTAPAAAPAIRLEQGELEGAKFTLARPARWNRCVLLLAHGLRPETGPLVADLFPEHAAYKALLDQGWIVAKTSYRRNGLIIHDAMTDLDNLRAEIVRRFGPPSRVIVEGDSMGGLIAVLMAERTPETTPFYHGVVAIGPALNLRETAPDASGLTMLAQIPIVFLCNRNEMEVARGYTQFKLPAEVKRTAPLLLRVNRDGHINVNQAERLVALRTLNDWLDQGAAFLAKPAEGSLYIDATRVPPPLPSRVFIDGDRRGFTAHVVEASRVFGNILLDAQPADFAEVGLSSNAWFRVTIREQNYRVFFGKDFTSVKRGEWVTFLNADGFFWLGRNGLNAAETTQAEVGDLVYVRRYDSATGAPGEALANPTPP